MANYAYIRVSSRDQNEDRQLMAVADKNVPEDNVYVDKQSGKNFDRENLSSSTWVTPLSLFGVAVLYSLKISL